MSLSFLPDEILKGLANLNQNFLSEIRLRKGQPIIVEYRGEYKYLAPSGLTNSAQGAIICPDTQGILNSATRGSVYSYAEQMKSGFITVGHGVRIGLAGEYVTQNGAVIAVNSVTSLNIRLPHDVRGCAEDIYNIVLSEKLCSVLIFSRPGLGKTTILRDLIRDISDRKKLNVLVFDERGELSAYDSAGNGYMLGDTVDVVRCSDKLGGISGAIRAMKPQVIVTDELYGEKDINAVKYAAECGICVIASTHITRESALKTMPFEYFVGLTKIGGRPLIYDKNFNLVGGNCADHVDRNADFGG